MLAKRLASLLNLDLARAQPNGILIVRLSGETMRKLLPWALIAIPLLYYFGLVAGAASYSGYSHMTNYASELGAAEAPYPLLFNVPIMLAGLAAIFSAALLPSALTNRGASRLWSILAAAGLGLFGVAMVMGGMFPMPNELHGGFGLGLAGPLIPLFVLLAIRCLGDTGLMQLFLGFVFLASVVMLAIMFGVGELVSSANVGLYQRLNTGASIPWFAVLGFWLMTRERSASGRR